jgi:hypothetical protein
MMKDSSSSTYSANDFDAQITANIGVTNLVKGLTISNR